jgi:hypothetical protein
MLDDREGRRVRLRRRGGGRRRGRRRRRASRTRRRSILLLRLQPARVSSGSLECRFAPRRRPRSRPRPRHTRRGPGIAAFNDHRGLARPLVPRRFIHAGARPRVLLGTIGPRGCPLARPPPPPSGRDVVVRRRWNGLPVGRGCGRLDLLWRLPSSAGLPSPRSDPGGFAIPRDDLGRVRLDLGGCGGCGRSRRLRRGRDGTGDPFGCGSRDPQEDGWNRCGIHATAREAPRPPQGDVSEEVAHTGAPSESSSAMRPR